MPRNTKPKPDRNWKASGEIALTKLLDKAAELADGCGDSKQLTELIKVVAEVVGTGLVLGRKPVEASGGDEDGDGLD